MPRTSTVDFRVNWKYTLLMSIFPKGDGLSFELWVVEGLTLERCSTFGTKDKLEPKGVYLLVINEIVKGTLEKRAESLDEVLLEITPTLCTFGRCSFEPSFSDSFQTLSVGPPKKEILRNSLRSCPLISNVESSGQVNLLLVLF
ncbi:hypothetical protein Tco_0534680 [Tanacetum coccineum]